MWMRTNFCIQILTIKTILCTSFMDTQTLTQNTLMLDACVRVQGYLSIYLSTYLQHWNEFFLFQGLNIDFADKSGVRVEIMFLGFSVHLILYAPDDTANLKARKMLIHLQHPMEYFLRPEKENKN